MAAVRASNFAKVKELLDSKKHQDLCADINYQHNQDMTPLHFAVKLQSIEIVNFLIENLAEVNQRTQTGETALHLSCRASNYDLVKILTKLQETFVDIQDAEGNTPMHYAAMANALKIVQHLTKNCKGNPSILNNRRQKPRDVTTDQTLKFVRTLPH